MQSLGFFVELGMADPDGGRASIMEATRVHPDEDKGRMLEYLSSGYRMLDIMEGGRDVVNDSAEPISDTASILFDGAWYWRRDLQVYYERYDVALPDEFVDHVRRNAYRVPEIGSDELADASVDIMRHLGFA